MFVHAQLFVYHGGRIALVRLLPNLHINKPMMKTVFDSYKYIKIAESPGDRPWVATADWPAWNFTFPLHELIPSGERPKLDHIE